MNTLLYILALIGAGTVLGLLFLLGWVLLQLATDDSMRLLWRGLHSNKNHK